MNTSKLNPGFKGLTIFLISLILSFEYNYYINISVFLICLILMLLSKVSIKRLCISFLPVIIMALGVFFTGYFYGNESATTDITDMTKIVVVMESAESGLQLAARILAYAGLGFLFVYTTDPRMFILSLMQQFRLSEKFAYGIMAAYNFIPIVKNEYRNITYAYRARGVKRNLFMLPMLVTAIRSSENIAMAMESKGFQIGAKRSQYRKLETKMIDYILVVLLPLITLYIVRVY
ncbi:energy-coupling factor transporter transmembrane component T family protein [Fusobacterium sp. SYSU M8A802]